MSSVIRIKRSSGILAPATLKTAELAYAYGTGTTGNQGDRLFVGKGDDGTGQATSVVVIGGSYFTDMLDHNPGLLRTNSAIIVDSDKKIEELKSGNIHIDGFNDKILGLVAPTDSSGATTKRYVDSAISDTRSYIDSEIFAAVYDSTGVVAGTYGGATSIPIIKVDDFGRVDSVGTSPLSTTLMVSADSGTADSVDLINDTLNFSGTNSIITKVTDGNIDIRLDSSHQATHLASYGAVYPGLYTYGGGSSLPRVSVDNFGIVKHIDQTNILAEITLRDEPGGSPETLYTSQNDLVVTGGPGVNVNLTKSAYNGPTTFEISVDSGGAIAADSATFTKLKVDVGTDHGGMSTSNRIELYGDIKLGNDINNHQLDLGDVRITSNLNPQSVNVSHFGQWGNPFASLSLASGLNFAGTAGQDHINIRSDRDSALTISTVQSTGIYPTATGDMVTYRTKNGDSAVVHHVDIVVDNNKNAVFGSGYTWNGNPVPGKTTMRHDTTDHWFEMLADSHTTGIEIAGRGVTLRGYDLNYGFRSGQGAVTGNGYIELDGNIVPAVGLGQSLYNQGYRRDLGKSVNRFGTLYVDSVDRGHYIDSGTYGNAAAIPVFTVNKSGLIDSISTLPVAGVDSVGWLSHETFPGNPQNFAIQGSSTLEIKTGDGTVHSAPIKLFADSANFQNVIRPHGGVRMGLTGKIEFGNTTVYGPSATKEYNGPTGSGLIERNTADGSFGHKKGIQIYDNDGIRLHAQNLWLQTYDYGYGSGHDSTQSNSGNNIYMGGHLVAKPQSAQGPYDIGEDSAYSWRDAYFTGKIKANEIQLTSGGKVVADSGTFATLTLSELITDNIKIDGNTISSTDSSNQIFIDPFPVGDSGDLVIRGNLIVQGTQTTVNSSIVSLNDKNLVLADSAATAAIADGAGLTVGGDQFDSTATKPQFVFDAATYRWDPNLPIDIPFVSLDSAVFLNGVALREVMEDHLDNFFGVDSNNAVTITYDDAANTMTWKGTDATTSQKGVSSFDSSNFTIAAGHVSVTVLDGGTY